MQINYLFSCLICLLALQPVFAQTSENLEQRNAAINFITLIQDEKLDAAAAMLDQSRIVYDGQLKEVWKRAGEDIDDVSALTITGIITEKNDSMVCYHCRYYSPKEKFPDYYRVDISFADAQSLKISKVVFYNRDALVKMKAAGDKPSN